MDKKVNDFVINGKKREIVHLNRTIFDDVFKTIIRKMPELVIPVINEVFDEHYPENEKIQHLINEYQTENGDRITDSCLSIRDKLYHIECQSNPDNTMVVRMVEYDFAIALSRADIHKGEGKIDMPRSCILYLRHTTQTPDVLKMQVIFSENETAIYEVPIIKVKDYARDEIFQKKLLMFLPFYIMRYEGRYDEIEKNPQMFNELLIEYDTIRKKLEKLAIDEDKSVLYSNLVEQIIKISDYMLRKEKQLQERMSTVMGGQVLELLSERAERLGSWKNSIKLYEKGIISELDAAENLNMTIEEFLTHVEEYKNGTLK